VSQKRQQGPDDPEITSDEKEVSEVERSGLGFQQGTSRACISVLDDPVQLVGAASVPSPTRRVERNDNESEDYSETESSDGEDERIVRDFLENADPIGDEDVISSHVFFSVVGLDASDAEDTKSESQSNDEDEGSSAVPMSKAAMKKQRKAEKKARLTAKRERIQTMETQARKIRNGLKKGSEDGSSRLHSLLGPINSTIKSFVSDPSKPGTGALPPMPAILRRPALQLAAMYRLKTGTHGHGQSKYTTLYRTQMSSVPADWNRLVELVLEESPSASEMTNTIPRTTSKADRRKGGSSAVRLNKDQARPAVAGYEIGEEIGGNAAPISSGVGFKLMEKMGWSAGMGLGPAKENEESSSLTEPIAVKVLARGRGLGHYDSER
jgi:hypothetical protein